MRNKYLHTINGQPAGYNGNQICYGWAGMPLANTLKQIRKEQRLTKKERKKWGCDDEDKYGYLRVEVA